MKDDIPSEKLTAKKLILLPPTLMNRLKQVSAVRGEEESKIIRRALVTELDRLEALVSVESQRLAKLQRIAAAEGVEVDVVIDRMLRDVIEPELPALAGVAL